MASLNYYPHGCAEQTVSRALPWLALGHPRAGTDPQVVRQRIRQAIERLSLMQTNDGGLAMWPSGRRTWRTGTLWAAWSATMAKQQERPTHPISRFRALAATGSRYALDDLNQSDRLVERPWHR